MGKLISTSLMRHLAFKSVAISLLLLTALHILRPDIHTASSMVSEYAIGKFGWIQTLVFFLFAVSAGAVLIAIRSEVETLWGKIGLFFLVLAAGGFFLGGIFNVEHPLHQFVFFVGAPGMAIAAALISLNIARTPAWVQIRRLVIGVGQLPWISFILNMSMFFLAFSPSGELNPRIPVGWGNRLFWLSSGLWLMVMAWHSAKVNLQKSSKNP